MYIKALVGARDKHGDALSEMSVYEHFKAMRKIMDWMKKPSQNLINQKMSYPNLSPQT